MENGKHTTSSRVKELRPRMLDMVPTSCVTLENHLPLKCNSPINGKKKKPSSRMLSNLHEVSI